MWVKSSPSMTQITTMKITQLFIFALAPMKCVRYRNWLRFEAYFFSPCVSLYSIWTSFLYFLSSGCNSFLGNRQGANHHNENLPQLHLWKMLIRPFTDDLTGHSVLLKCLFSYTQPLCFLTSMMNYLYFLLSAEKTVFWLMRWALGKPSSPSHFSQRYSSGESTAHSSSSPPSPPSRTGSGSSGHGQR